jgi:7-carboxy-7-deazaguanine synthase
MLCDQAYAVSLETSGALSIEGVDRRVTTVMDLKTPSSGEQKRNLYANLEHLARDDELKFVISDRADYDWVKATLNEYDLVSRVEILLSPNHELLQPRELAGWMLADALPVRLQVQLHKYMWGNEPGR